MPSRPWYKWYPSDYLADTLTMSLEADAFYRRLLDAFWTLGPLEATPKALGIATRIGTHKARHLSPEVLPYLDTLEDGRLTHWRVEEQRAQVAEIAAKRGEAGRKGGLAKAKAIATANASLRARVPDLRVLKDVKMSSESEDDSEEVEISDSDASSDNGSKGNGKHPPCPFEQIIGLYHKSLPQLPRYIKRTDTRDRRMRARWCEHPGLHNFETFFDTVADSPFLLGEVDTGRGPFRADLEWLMRPENFAKVIEGKYLGD